MGSGGKLVVSMDLVVTSRGAGFLGCSRVLGAVINDFSELNMVIRAAGDVNHDC